jgi:choline dehydrogenase-like flavoprotein
MEIYDVIIIGSGAGGGTLAHRLATKMEAKILVLERGDYLKREKENWDSDQVFNNRRYDADEEWIDKNGKPFRPGIHYFVGGNTKVYGSALMRMRERDFGEIEHEDGLSPAWPISYQELAPYYLEAEKLYHVHGLRGSDPYEPKESAPYPYPPVEHEPRIKELAEDLQKIGHSPFHLPIGIRLNESNLHESPCIKCETFDGFPCLVDGKADAQVIAVDPALKACPHLSLLTGCFVERLELDSSGKKVEKIHAIIHGEKRVFFAKTVIISCGAVNSAALLLRSNIANRSGAVGRHYMCHNNSAFMALSKKPNPTKFQKTLGISDFYFGAEDWKYPLGLIQMLGKSDGKMLKSDAPWLTPEFALEKVAKHSIDFWITTEDLPLPENRVIVDSSGKIHLHYTETNGRSHKKLAEKLKEVLKEIGCIDRLMPTSFYLKKKIPIAGVAHQCGTVRFGNNPATSVLDTHCKAHDVDNLFVVDASFFCSASSCNPALTVMANALRVGDYLIRRL